MSYIHMEDLRERMESAQHLVYAPREGGGAEVHLVKPGAGTYHQGVVLPGWAMMAPAGGDAAQAWPDVAVPKGLDDAMLQLRALAAKAPTGPCVVVVP